MPAEGNSPWEIYRRHAGSSVPPLVGLEMMSRNNVYFGTRRGTFTMIPEGTDDKIIWPKGTPHIDCVKAPSGHCLLTVSSWIISCTSAPKDASQSHSGWQSEPEEAGSWLASSRWLPNDNPTVQEQPGTRTDGIVGRCPQTLAAKTSIHLPKDRFNKCHDTIAVTSEPSRTVGTNTEPIAQSDGTTLRRAFLIGDNLPVQVSLAETLELTVQHQA